MSLKIESRYRCVRYSLVAGTIVAAGLVATPALADMVVQQTTSYASPPAIVVGAPAPPVVVEAPAPTVTYTYQAPPPVTYVERTETVTTVPAPPVTREVTVGLAQDTPKYDFTVHKRVQTAQVQTRTHAHKAAPRCQCQPTQ